MEISSLEKQLEDYILQNKEKHYRLAYSYVKNIEDALDVVQESIYKAFSNINTLRTPDYIKTWFYKILVNTAIALLRKQKRLVIIEDEFLDGINQSAVDTYEDIDLKKALESLPVKYRSVVELRYFEDLKIEEIAAILEENVNTIKTRLYKALKVLRISMDELELREDVL